MSARTFVITPVVEATPDYSTGDVMGGIIDLNVTDGIGTPLVPGYIVSVAIKSKADITVPIDVIFFNASPAASTTTENGALAVHADDVTKLVGAVQVAQWFDVGTPVLGFAECRIPIKKTGMYAILVPRGTINLASVADLIIEFGIDVGLE